MSHKIESNVADREARGLPVIMNEDILRATCKAQGLPEPVWVDDFFIGNDRDTYEKQYVTGFSVQLPDWTRAAVFNTKTGDVYFDNYPLYGTGHPDVVSGERRDGERGRWGDWSHMLAFEKEYVKRTVDMVPQWLSDEAVLAGAEFCVSSESNDKELVLEITS